MSEAVSHVEHSEHVGEVKDPAAEAAKGRNASQAVGEAKINSLQELQTKYPELYRALSEGIVSNILSQNRRHMARFKEIIREGQKDTKG